MTITLIGTGGLFTRTGVFGRCANNLNGLLDSTAPSPGSAWGAGGPTINDLQDQIDLLEAQFQSADRDLVTGANDIYAARDNVRSGLDSLKTTLQSANLATLIRMADNDVGLSDPTSLPLALGEIVRQMTSSADTILGPTITVTPGAGIPVATGTLVVAASLKDPTGKSLDYVYAETLDLVCTADSFSGGATASRETLSVTGDAAEPNLLSWRWPKGSGASKTISATDAAENAGSNLLTNGSFDTFTVVDTPDSWTVVAGSVGTAIKQENSDVYAASAHALKLVGDGAVAHQIKQAITGLVSPRDVLALNVQVHVDAAAPAAGKLRFALVDGSGTVINDDNGVANSYTVNCALATLQTTYVATGAMTTVQLDTSALAGGAGQIFFRVPTNMPSAIYVEVKFTTVLSNAKNVFVDHMALVKATQAYGSGIGGGPYLAAFSGTTKLVVNDRFKVVVASNYGGAFSKWLWRICNLPSLGIRIPSLTSANTVNENLIV